MAIVERKAEFAHGPDPDHDLTFVPLFHYTQAELISSRSFYETAAKFFSDYKKSREYWQTKTQETTKLKERVEEHIGQTSMHVVASMSFVATSMAYLKFLDDLKPQGLSEQQIFDFFKPCLAINTKGSVVYDVSEAEAEQAYLRDKSPEFQHKQITPYVQRAMRHIPEWFKGAPIEYASLLEKYSTFGLLLNPQLVSMTHAERIQREKQRARSLLGGEEITPNWGATIAEGIPDWVDENKPPERSLLETELAADIKEYQLVGRERTSLIRAQNYLTKSFQEKYNKYTQRFNERWEEVKIADPRLGDFLSFLGFCLEEEDLSKYIRFYIQLEGRIYDPEAQALWIEDSLKKAGVLEKGALIGEGRELLGMMFFALRGLTQQEEREKLSYLRQTNKKGHDAIRFQLQPLVNTLTDEDVLLLDDFVNEAKDDQAGSFVSFFADVLVARIKQIELGKNPALDKCLSEFREFFGKVLRNNWQILFHQFEGVIFGDQVPAYTPAPSEASSDEEAQAVAELEDELTQIRDGNLSGWRIFYSADQTTYPSHLIEIPGPSLDEKCDELQSLFVKLGVSSSVKLTSIIHAIDWKTQIPSEVEHLIPTIIVKGEVWKKIKRGSVRILYQMNPQTQTFVFFVHQKKDYYYNLPAA